MIRTRAAFHAGMPPLNRPIKIDAPRLNAITAELTVKFCRKIMSSITSTSAVVPNFAPNVPSTPPINAISTDSASISAQNQSGAETQSLHHRYLGETFARRSSPSS